MDFNGLKEYVIKKLKDGLNHNLKYHGLHHTLDVYKSVVTISKFEKIGNMDSTLLKSAALLHDIGFIKQYENNEEIAATMAAKILPKYAYDKDQIELIQKLIMVTALPQRPTTTLERIICDADLDYLGRNDFEKNSIKLREEWVLYKKQWTDLEWNKIQLDFLQEHQYFTKFSKTNRTDEKEKNIKKIEKSIVEIKRALSGDFNEGNEFDAKVKTIQALELFSAADSTIATEVAKLLKVRFYQKGDSIIEKGEEGTYMCIINKGTVKVHDGKIVIVDMHAGNFFGEISLLDAEPRSASVTAKTDCVLFILEQEDFYFLLQKHSFVARHIMKILLGRLRNQNKKITLEAEEKERQLQQLVDKKTSELKNANNGLKSALGIIEQKNKDITDSINYARRIQDAILPIKENFTLLFPESFLLYEPKDIVSGDFYWFEKIDANNQKLSSGLRSSYFPEISEVKTGASQKIIIAAADCTGHGVPGAFMSMIGSNLLNQIIIEKANYTPGTILKLLNKNIKYYLKQTGQEGETRDGMDIALCTLDLPHDYIQNDANSDSKKSSKKSTEKFTLQFSGANRYLYLFRKNPIEGEPFPIMVATNKMAIGGFTSDDYDFQNHELEVFRGDTFYIFTDGYADQFGGEHNKKFMKKQLKQLLANIYKMDLRKQETMLKKIYVDWKGEEEQTDDILVIGVRV